MRFLAIAVLILAVVSAAGAVDRATVPNNAEAYCPPSDPQHGPQNGDGVTIVALGRTTVYYNLAQFLAVLAPGYYFDNFSWLGWGTINQASYTFGPVNGFTYTASAANGLYSIAGAMSTNSLEDPLNLSFAGGLPVTAVGGDFYGTDFNGNPMSGTTTVTLNDGTTVQLAYPATFVGFTSVQPITAMTISTAIGGGLWPTYDNFYVGQQMTTPVEHESWSRIKTLFR